MANRISAPPPADLLSRYITAGAPVREGWLYHIHASARTKQWVVLFCSRDDMEMLSEAHVQRMRLYERATIDLRGTVRSYNYPEVELTVCEFGSREAGTQFEREAIQFLTPECPGGGMLARVGERAIKIAAEASALRLQWQVSRASAAKPNELVHEFFDFVDP